MNPKTAIATRTMTPASAGTAVQDYGWEKAVITHWCGVNVLDVAAENTVRVFGPDTIVVTEIILTVSTTRDAQALAVLLGLPAAPSDPALAWQTWTGWVSEISAHRPVLVRVTAPVGMPQEAS
ncbi:hypothetical protein C8K30_11553 [Promicromonospora sp. AC04]|uniref:hypothetical protein n=1 Tax=Promicromonospora sp. AC04 TaxID=2135723 RepID=UPI000D39FFED|nr:hypothetical protein [Promicromonospora sp. AC04]PUB20842.1 hypothetical protein C8K30_11553 [Promicromonospora sp. AC04]